MTTLNKILTIKSLHSIKCQRSLNALIAALGIISDHKNSPSPGQNNTFASYMLFLIAFVLTVFQTPQKTSKLEYRQEL